MTLRPRKIPYFDLYTEIITKIILHLNPEDHLFFALTCKQILEIYRSLKKNMIIDFHVFFFTKSRFDFAMTMKKTKRLLPQEEMYFDHHLRDHKNKKKIEICNFFKKSCVVLNCKSTICGGCFLQCEDCSDYFCRDHARTFQHNTDHITPNCLTTRKTLCAACNTPSVGANAVERTIFSECGNGKNCNPSGDNCLHCSIACKVCDQLDCRQCTNDQIVCIRCDLDIGPLCTDCLKFHIFDTTSCYFCNRYFCSDCIFTLGVDSRLSLVPYDFLHCSSCGLHTDEIIRRLD